MKVIFLLVLFPLIAFSAEKKKEQNFSFRCVNSVPATSFLLTEEGNQVLLTTIHHNGTAYMPIHEGIVVPNDLPLLNEKSKILPLMGTSNEFKFPKDRCKIYGPGQISCFGGESKKFGDKDIQVQSVSTSKTTEDFMGAKFVSYKVLVQLNISGFTSSQFISMNYFDNECEFDF